MEKKYSLAIHLPQKETDSVKKMKEDLCEKTEWFPSKNSIAHITIGEFEIDDSEIENIKHQAHKKCDTFTPFQVLFNHFSTFENGAFFIAPTLETEERFKPIMKKMRDSLKIHFKSKSDKPHITIGRQLKPEQLQIAHQLFTTIHLEFLCQSIVLREYDPIKRQFFVIETFPFGSNPQPELVQGSLF